MKKIDRYVIKTDGGIFSPIKRVVIKDRLTEMTVCEFVTDDKKFNMELAEYCLKRIEEHDF